MYKYHGAQYSIMWQDVTRFSRREARLAIMHAVVHLQSKCHWHELQKF